MVSRGVDHPPPSTPLLGLRGIFEGENLPLPLHEYQLSRDVREQAEWYNTPPIFSVGFSSY